MLVLNVLLCIFPNLFIKIGVSLFHFTDGKTEAQSVQEASQDKAPSLWAAFSVLGASFSSSGLPCVALGKSLPSLGCSSREGALRPLSQVFQPTREIPASELSTPGSLSFPHTSKAGPNNKAGPILVQGDQNFSVVPEMSSHQAEGRARVSQACAGPGEVGANRYQRGGVRPAAFLE